MEHTINVPVFQPGTVIQTNEGEVRIESFQGMSRRGYPVYRVVAAKTRVINGHPVNVFMAEYKPVLTVTGVAV